MRATKGASTSTPLERDARLIHADDHEVKPGEIAIGVIIGRTSEFFDFFVYALASVLVFPSRTDTYGLVMLEALACGTPVAAFPVAGPLDVLQQGLSGVMDEDLGAACLAALELDRGRCAELAGHAAALAAAGPGEPV